jgi:hypothetical protein
MYLPCEAKVMGVI